MFSANGLRAARLLLLLIVGCGTAVAMAHDEAPRRTNLVRSVDADSRGSVSRTQQQPSTTQLGAFVPDGLLIARFDGAPYPLTMRPVVATTMPMNDLAYFDGAAADDPNAVRYGLGLSKPGRWTSIATTLALCLFFFLRRMV